VQKYLRQKLGPHYLKSATYESRCHCSGLASRSNGPSYRSVSEIGKAFGRLETAAEATGLLGPSAVLIAIYYDSPLTTPAADLRSDAGLVVETGARLPPSLTDTVIPGGRYLRGRHVGSYDGLPAAWAYLRERGLRDHGLQRGPGPAYELYPNNPGNAAASDLITDIYIPVL
jgi:AraC family transcriptional regulator